MGNNSPSRYRKEGKKAFIPNSNPNDFCPYRASFQSWKKESWFEGWKLAALEYEEEQKEAEKEQNEWEGITCQCPWYSFETYSCNATERSCSKEECAIWFFKQLRK